MISIIVTAYNNTLYIKEALDSIIESCGDVEYEILVGVDNCPKTLEYLNSIRGSLPNTVNILFFTNKVGTYIIRNTLASISKYDKLLFFDSDDVMRKILVPNVIKYLETYDYIRYGYMSFNGKLNLPKDGNLQLVKKHFHVGTFGINKEVFIGFNGFEPWICASDGEFYWRILSNNKKIKTLDIVGLFYRRHETNLTSDPNTGMNSPLRKSYHKKREEKEKNKQIQPLEKLVTSEFIQLNDGTINEIKKFFNNFIKKQIIKQLSLIIPTYKNPEYLVKCLDSVVESSKNYDVEILVGIDSCNETLNYIKEKKFDQRIRFFFFHENVGPYVIKNSLSQISNSETLLFFDSDDIMKNNMIDEVIHLQKYSDFVKPMYINFDEQGLTEEIKNTIRNNKFGEGVFSIKKNLFLHMNGFEGWRCMADSDFMNRLYSTNKKGAGTKEVSFYRRIHKQSLTQDPKTSYSSELRQTYYKISKNRKDFGPLPFITVSLFYEIFDKEKINKLQFMNNSDLIGFEIKSKRDEVLNSIGLFKKRKENKPVDYVEINKILSKDKVYVPKENIKPIRENKPNKREELIELRKGSVAKQVRILNPGKPNRRNNLPNIF